MLCLKNISLSFLLQTSFHGITHHSNTTAYATSYHQLLSYANCDDIQCVAIHCGGSGSRHRIFSVCKISWTSKNAPTR